MNKIELTVNGMSCEGCESRIEASLQKIDGIKKVKASHKKSKVTITLEKDIDKNLITSAIEELGYTVK